MRRAIMRTLAIAGILAATDAGASCIGSGSFATCMDNYGNSYTINRMGNTTIMNGHNSQTGSSWSQNSTTFGNTTIHNGTTNGNSWNATDARMGSMRSIYGTDSRGNSFSRTCGPLGCF